MVPNFFLLWHIATVHTCEAFSKNRKEVIIRQASGKQIMLKVVELVNPATWEKIPMKIVPRDPTDSSVGGIGTNS